MSLWGVDWGGLDTGMAPFSFNRRHRCGLRKKIAPMQFFQAREGTLASLRRCAVRIVTFCPPALAIHDMGPDALTSPPPVAPPGPNLSRTSGREAAFFVPQL